MNNDTSAMPFRMLPERDRKLQYNKQLGMRMANLLIGTEYESYAHRMRSCATHLVYEVKSHITTGEIKYDLQSIHTCKVRVDPVCTWARSRIWRSRLDDGLTRLMIDHPSTRFIFLTLTDITCDVTELGAKIKLLNKSFDKLLKRRGIKNNVLGYIKSTEITRRFDWYDSKGKFIERHGTTWFKRHASKKKHTWTAKPSSEVHPHFHVLLAVKPNYFSRAYITQLQWIEYWKESLGTIEFRKVDIRTVKPNPKYENDKLGLLSSVLELAKYSTKPCDLVFDKDFLAQFIKQIHGTKHIVTGGLIKKYVNDTELSEEDIVNDSSEETIEDEWIEIDRVYFDFDESKNIYQLRES
jgi:plasmid rolling circle replication initiator protein Rep